VRPDIAIGEALRAVARDILAEARAALEDRTKPDAVAVHDYRKAMKRWRALLRLLAPFLGDLGERLRVDARDLARALAGARDAQAAIDALEDLAEAEGEDIVPLSPRSMGTIRGRLEALRQNAESASLTDGMRQRLLDSLDTAAAAVTLWPVEQVDFGMLSQRLADGYRAVRRAVPDAWIGTEPESLHDLRRRVVAHRYQMELVEPLWPKLGRLWVSEAQRLRDRLGSHQDLEMLAAFTAPHKALAPWRSRLAPRIAARQAAHARNAARLAGRLLAEKPKAFRQRLKALWEHRADEDEEPA
jgi:CHAD domain-containing protein